MQPPLERGDEIGAEGKIRNRTFSRAKVPEGGGSKSRGTTGRGKLAASRRDATPTQAYAASSSSSSSSYAATFPRGRSGPREDESNRGDREGQSRSVESCPEVDGCPATAGLGRGTSSFGTSSARRGSPRSRARGPRPPFLPHPSGPPPSSRGNASDVPDDLFPRRDVKPPPREIQIGGVPHFRGTVVALDRYIAVSRKIALRREYHRVTFVKFIWISGISRKHVRVCVSKRTDGRMDRCEVHLRARWEVTRGGYEGGRARGIKD